MEKCKGFQGSSEDSDEDWSHRSNPQLPHSTGFCHCGQETVDNHHTPQISSSVDLAWSWTVSSDRRSPPSRKPRRKHSDGWRSEKYLRSSSSSSLSTSSQCDKSSCNCQIDSYDFSATKDKRECHSSLSCLGLEGLQNRRGSCCHEACSCSATSVDSGGSRDTWSSVPQHSTSLQEDNSVVEEELGLEFSWSYDDEFCPSPLPIVQDAVRPHEIGTDQRHRKRVQPLAGRSPGEQDDELLSDVELETLSILSTDSRSDHLSPENIQLADTVENEDSSSSLYQVGVTEFITRRLKVVRLISFEHSYCIII